MARAAMAMAKTSLGSRQPRATSSPPFSSRSTPTGTLPTDQDLFNAITRGFITSNMPNWAALTFGQSRWVIRQIVSCVSLVFR
jgi:hypothetical protein